MLDISFQFRDESRGRPILVDLWYPTHITSITTPYNYNPGNGFVIKDAEHIDTCVPLILLSHGAFGAARNYSWIAEFLASKGYMVAGISHYGESFIYGPETIDPGSILNPKLRSEDCSFILDNLVSGKELSGFIDNSRIGALGHSSGGATVLELGGAVFNPGAMYKYCESVASYQDKGCKYARQLKVSLTPNVNFSCRDDRIKVIIALDPALGPGHTDESLRSILMPVFIIGVVQNDFLPYKYHAGRYAKLIPDATHTKLNNGEGHFIFLNESNSKTESNGVPLYKDREGILRVDVHNRLKEEILVFYNKYFKS